MEPMEKAGRVADRSQIIADLVKAIVAGYSPERIILFGSFAYGEPDEGSDIDLLIIKDTEEPFLDRMFAVRRLVRELHLRVGFDPIIVTPAELEQRLNIGDQFLAEACQRGKTLYAAR